MVRVAVMVLLSFSAFAQSDEKVDSVSAEIGKQIDKVFNTKVYMNVDTTIFSTHQGNFYIAEAEKAMIMTLVAPQAFPKAEEHFNKEGKKDGYKVLEKKKFAHNGKNYIYQKGLLKKDGKKMIMYLYGIEEGSDTTIIFTGMHMAGDEEKFFPIIEKAALSARLKK